MQERCCALPDFKYQRIDNRKNNIAIRFFRCAIHATDSTFTGWTAKIMAAKNAPGMDKLPQDNPNQEAANNVQNQVGGVVARRVHSPQPPLHPQRGVGNRPVIDGFGGAPQPEEAVGGFDQRVLGQKVFIVPDEPPVYRGKVGEEGQTGEEKSAGQYLEIRLRRTGNSLRSGSGAPNGGFLTLRHARTGGEYPPEFQVVISQRGFAGKRSRKQMPPHGPIELRSQVGHEPHVGRSSILLQAP